MKAKMLFALLGATALTACATPSEMGQRAMAEDKAASAARQDETARLNAFFEEKWEEFLDFSPIFKTFLGRTDDYAEIDDFSEAAADRQLAWRRDMIAQMRNQFDYDALDEEGRLSYDIAVFQLEQQERGLPFRRRNYVFHQMNGPHSFLPNFMINFHKVEEPAHMDAYVARLDGVSRAIGQAVEQARLNASEGVHAPAFAYDGVVKQSRALITGAPFAGEGVSPLMADATAKIESLKNDALIDDAQAEAYAESVRTALKSAFKPAIEGVIAFAEEDRLNSPEVATGVGILPNGEAYYEERLAFSTTTEMSADEVHQIGLDEVARIRAEMEAIKNQVGFEGSLQDFFEFMREDDQFYYPNTDEGREEYLEAARGHLAFINERLPQYFGILPKADLVVKRVEAFRERDGGAQHYFPGTPDGSRPGIYYNHLSDMRAMPIPQLEVIAYHEGNPGHHMQNSIAQEKEGLPEFRNQASFTAYGEGWALYSELLAKEMGAYQDPYSDFGRLTTEIWRAIRLVVDTGLHSKGWSQQEAVDYFTANSPAAAGQIASEVRRYIVMPGQATAYKIGMLKIQELRARAETELGDRFDIRGFHDTVLGGGAMPLELLERRVIDWIAEEKSKA